jgi:branched-chain amino acid transport system permease protein
MNKLIRSGLVLGSVGGFGVILFGGWSMATIGVLIGVALGLSLSSQVVRKDPLKTGLQALPASGAAAVLLIVISLFQNYVLNPAIGKYPSDLSTVIAANLLGGLGLILLAGIVTGLHGLSPRREQIGRTIVLALVVVTFPFVDNATGLRWTSQIIFALIFVILGLGLNIVVGFAGLLDLGYAAFFAIGAYTTGILSSPQHNIFLNFWLVIWISAAVAAIFGLILGAPTLPLRGDYLAIVTLGFGEIVPVIFRNLIKVTIQEPVTCWIWPGILKLFGSTASVKCITFMQDVNLTAGEAGINPIGRPWFPFVGPLPTDLTTIHGSVQLGKALWLYIGEFQSSNPITWYFLIIAIILLSVFLIGRLYNSRLGRAWMAIREDELAASQMGIDPVRTKLLAFSMGATFSGFAGAFYAAYIRGIFPSAFDFSASIIILCIVILGGLGNINGVIVGGVIIMTADRLFLPALKDLFGGLMDHTILPALASNPTMQAAVAQNANPILYRYLLFGLTLVIMMAVRPEGLVPSAQRRMELHAAEDEPVAPVVETAEKPMAKSTGAGKR